MTKYQLNDTNAVQMLNVTKKNLKKKFQLKLKNATSTKFNFGDNYDIYFLPHPLKKIQKIRD